MGQPPDTGGNLMGQNGLWNKIALDEDTGCWLWTSFFDKDGYGKFCTRRAGKQVTVRPHRLIYQLLIDSELAPSVILRHLCNVRSCVHPFHLLPGTHADNIHDMDEAGRRDRVHGAVRPGALHSRVKLTEAQVLEIRARFRLELGLTLAREFDVSSGQISSIIHRRSWRHI